MEMYNKILLNLFKPGRRVFMAPLGGPEAPQPASKESKSEEAESVKKFRKDFAERVLKGKEPLSTAHQRALTGLEAEYNKKTKDLDNNSNEKKILDEWKKQNEKYIEDLCNKYVKAQNQLDKARSATSYYDTLIALDNVGNILSADAPPDLEKYIRTFKKAKFAWDKVYGESRVVDDYQGNDKTDSAGMQWLGIQAALIANGIDTKNMDDEAKNAYDSSSGDQMLTLEALSNFKMQLASGEESTFTIEEACGNHGIDTNITQFEAVNGLINYYLGTLLATAEIKFKDDSPAFNKYAEYLKDQFASNMETLKNIGNEWSYYPFESNQTKLLVALMQNFKGPDEWSVKKAPEAVSEAEGDILEMLSALQDNAPDFVQMPDSNVKFPKDYVYARINDGVYRTTPEKQKLEKAVVENNKIEWKPITGKDDTEKNILSHFGISFAGGEAKKAPEPAAAPAQKEAAPAPVTAPAQKEVAPAQGPAPTSEKPATNLAPAPEPSRQMPPESKGAREIGTEWPKKREKIRKKVQELKLDPDDLGKKEIVGEVKKGNKTEKFFTIANDGTITFETHEAYRAIRLADIFPGYTGKLKVTTGGKEEVAEFENGNEKGKHVVIRNGSKIEKVVAEEKNPPERKEKTEPPREEQPQNTPYEEQRDIAWKMRQEDIEKKEKIAIPVVAKELEKAIGEKINKIADSINKGNYDDALKALNQLEANCKSEPYFSSLNKFMKPVAKALEDQPSIKDLATALGSNNSLDTAVGALLNNIYIKINNTTVKWKGRDGLDREDILKLLDGYFAKSSPESKNRYRTFLDKQLPTREIEEMTSEQKKKFNEHVKAVQYMRSLLDKTAKKYVDDEKFKKFQKEAQEYIDYEIEIGKQYEKNPAAASNELLTYNEANLAITINNIVKKYKLTEKQTK